MTGAVSGPSGSRLAASSGGPLTAARRHWRLEGCRAGCGTVVRPATRTSDACKIAHPDSQIRTLEPDISQASCETI